MSLINPFHYLMVNFWSLSIHNIWNRFCRWYYKTEAELGGSSHWGLLSTYSGAGNIADLKDSKIRSADYIQYLLDNIWIRRGTRVVFIDFTTYNANINLFCAVRFVFVLSLQLEYKFH